MVLRVVGTREGQGTRRQRPWKCRERKPTSALGKKRVPAGRSTESAASGKAMLSRELEWEEMGKPQ